MTYSRFMVVGIGESLYDVFPDRQVLGGAPLNFAVHARRLAAACGGAAAVVSRVGQDALGEGIITEARERGLEIACLQTDPDHPTGRANVQVDAAGQPTYDIVHDVAWDWIQFDPDLETLARRCQAACFGTLAQRNSQSRNTIYRFLDAMPHGAIRMFDINLRQDFFDARCIRRSLELATTLKINDEELAVVADVLGLANAAPDKAIASLRREHGLSHVVFTRGERGTVLYDDAGPTEGTPAHYPAADAADAVGAGDACGAASIIGILLGWPAGRIADTANRAGAFVAAHRGATPELPDGILSV